MRPWFSMANRAGRMHAARDKTRVVVPGTNPRECKCGSPGPRMCVCDETWDKLARDVVHIERRAQALARKGMRPR